MPVLPGNFEGGLYEEFRNLQREIDQAFGASPWPAGLRSVARGTYPPINVGSTAEQVDVYLFVAGVDPNSLDISIQRNLLTVGGARNVVTEEGANYYRRERFDGAFRRVVTLPEDVDPERVDASYRDGVLHVAIRRQASAKPRRITVN